MSRATPRDSERLVLMDELYYPTINPADEAWKDQANCVGIDTNLFFTSGEGKGDDRDTTILRRICAGCSVKNECLDYAIKYSQLGWWGGTTEAERKRIRRKVS